MSPSPIFGEFCQAGKITARVFLRKYEDINFGAGAVGGYFGGKLFVSGSDVTFLVRDSRKKQLLATGLKIYSPHGDFSADVKCKTITENAEIYDLVLLCCKAYQLQTAISDLRKFLKAPSYILPVLNGLSHIGELQTHFGKDKVLGAPPTLPQQFLKKVTSNN